MTTVADQRRRVTDEAPRPTAGTAQAQAVAACRRAAARAGGCAARAPSLEALGLAWRLRADALALAAAYAAADRTADKGARERTGADGGPADRRHVARLRGLARAWAAGAARLAGRGVPGPRWPRWFDEYLARSAALPGEGAAWAAMRAEFAVWRIAHLVGAAERTGAAPNTCAEHPYPARRPTPALNARA